MYAHLLVVAAVRVVAGDGGAVRAAGEVHDGVRLGVDDGVGLAALNHGVRCAR